MNRKAILFIVRIAVATVSFALIALAFLRGNYLLGFGYGVAYAMLTAGLVWLLARSLTFSKKPSAGRAIAVTILSIPIAYVMAYPTLINSDFHFFIADQATDRAARAELWAIFTTDPAFANLSLSTTHLKVVNITIYGSLPKHADFERLRARIANECQVVKGCPIHWSVTLRDTEQPIDGLDRELFRPGR